MEKIIFDRMASILLPPVIHTRNGFLKGKIPWLYLFLIFSTSLICHTTRLDFLGFRLLGLEKKYPVLPQEHLKYLIGVSISIWLGWCYWEEIRRCIFKKRLEETLLTSGLKNPLGKIPKIVDHLDLDQETSKLVLSKASFSLADFTSKKSRLESGLLCYIEDIREIRNKGLVEIVYSSLSLPSAVSYQVSQSKDPFTFLIGSTRANSITGNFRETPHLLVAGQTGGGKSTFLRNVITSLYLNSSSKFTLIDLKGGLEFQLFENLPRVNVIPNLEQAILDLVHLRGELERRLAIIKSQKKKDIWDLENSSSADQKLARHFVVIDEAAELFLASGQGEVQKVIQAKKVLSLIARQGRAVGIHLIVATQRPDSRAVDTQVKANLTGVICFPMQNDSSSISVLGNGRATDLPSIAGRAIWKDGTKMIEVQTPYLSIDRAEQLLEPVRNAVTNTSRTK